MLPLPPSISHSKILIVDDTLENLQLLANMLEVKGYVIRKTTSGKLALQYVQLDPPDLILLDINMPEMDGYEVCKQLKKLEQTHDIPVLFISAFDQLDHKLQAFTVGGNDYITKPFQDQEVLMRVQNQLLIQQQRRELQVQNHLLEEEVAKRTIAEQSLSLQIEREKLLRNVIHYIRQSLNFDEILKRTVTKLRQLLQADRVLIYHNQKGVIVIESDAEDVSNLQECCLHNDLFLQKCHECYRYDLFQVIENIDQEQLSPDLVKALQICGVKSKLIVPIVTSVNIHPHLVDQSERPWGLLVFHQCHYQRNWSQVEIDLVKQVADQLAIALQQSELYQQLLKANAELEMIATTDALTGVANRRGFDQYLTRTWNQLAREQQPISIVLCDIDHFKQYNDTYGHPAGDECLSQVASALRSQLKRAGDLVARYGGEEFVIVLPNTDAIGAIQIVESLLKEIENLKIPHIANLVADHVTISFGISSMVTSPHQHPQLAIDQADQALYHVKQNGRNGYWLYSPSYSNKRDS
jgi:two-component system cell cycle response regulator